MNLEHVTPELFAAMAKAQAALENAAKNAANPHFRSRYADLAECLNAARPVYAAHGLSILQSTGYADGMVSVETVIAHASGGWVSSIASCVPAKTDAQGIGAATTYLRRYGLAAMTALGQEDDDGTAAAHAQTPESAQKAGQDFTARIMAATDYDALNAIGIDVAAAALSPKVKATLRDTFHARREQLKEQTNG